VHAYLLTNRLFSGRTPLYLPPDSVRARSPSSPADTSLWLPRWHDGRTVPELRAQVRFYVRKRLSDMEVPIRDPASLHVEWRTRTHRIGGSPPGAETERVLSSYTLPLAP
jgi:hypothetical protein